MTNLIGTLLHNRYRIVKVLAQGGQSETFVAEDTHLPGHPECVVKRLKTANKDPERLANAKRLFEREAHVLQTQICPRFDQIPKLLAYFELEGEFYLIQELIRGHTLSTEMPNGSRWSEARVLELLRDILWILNFIHNQGMIHRDLKPDNLIRRSRDHKLVLIDFGAVKTCLWEEERGSTLAIGTLGYMPFEQAMGQPVPASDLYALGMIAIQALTGVPPRQLPKVDDGEVCWREQAPAVSEGLAEILTRMVRYRPQQRYQTAMEVLEALQTVAPQDSDPNTSATLSPDVSRAETAIPKDASHAEDTVTHMGSAILEASSSPSIPAAIQPPFNADSKPRGWRRTATSALSVVALIGISILSYGIWSQREEHFTARLTLERMNTAIALGQFERCQTHMAGIPSDMPLYEEMVERLGKCQLEQAQHLAREHRWGEAVALARSLPPDLEIYPEAVRLQQTWSDQQRRQELQQTLNEMDLASAAGIDYSTLSELMAAGQWQQADRETDRILLRLSQRQQEEFLDLASIRSLPCIDLQTLDQLWTRFSDGQFGFGVQMTIWARSNEIFTLFADRVGWRENNRYLNYHDLTVDRPRSKQGTLPFASVLRGDQMSLYRDQEWWLYRDREHFAAFFQQLMQCEMI